MQTNKKTFYKRNKNLVSKYPKNLFQKLEFDKIIELLTSKCKSPLGKAYVQRMRVTADVGQIEKMLDQVHQFKQLIMQEEQAFPDQHFFDLSEELKQLAIINFVLNEGQIFRIYKVLLAAQQIFHYFDTEERQERYPELLKLVVDKKVDSNLINHIKNVLDEEGKIRSDASKELIVIRRSINRRYKDLDSKFKSIINECKKMGWLTDSMESIRGGRRVLSVNAQHKRKVRGIIHDESNTGSTSFIEPEGILQINNEIVELQQAEKREIYRILRELTKQIHPYHETIAQYQKTMGLFDFIRAKAQLAWDLNAQRPSISSNKIVEIHAARHPLLFLKNKAEKKKTIPLTFELSLAKRIIVVSGPNAGGKSVMLKTVGLLQLMLQTGLLVPLADHSIMMVYRNIFVDIGDEQSIENDLSTYSSHLRNMRYFTQNSDGKTLLLMDEFGSGTDPSLGGAIAEAILEQLTQKFCYGIITTHYANLKVYATHTKGIVNGCMTFDYHTFSPKYKLEMGKPGSSFAFELASKSGLSKQLIARAKSKVDVQYKKFDELLSSLQREKQEVLERERIANQREAEYAALLQEYNKLKAGLEKNKKKIILETQEKALLELSDKNKKFENLIKTLKENKRESKVIRQIKEEVAKDKKSLSTSIETLKDEIYYQETTEKVSVGASVRLRTGGEVGEVIEVRKNRTVVEFGRLRTHVKTKQLVVVEAVEKPENRGGATFHNNLKARSEFETNVDLRGMRREEALQVVDELLDRALLFDIPELKIVHGIGNGILRKSVRELLRKYKHVKTVRDEEPQYGGRGVSIVELK